MSVTTNREQTVHITKGDTLTPLRRTLYQGGEVVNLTGKTVTFRMVDDAGTEKVAATSATVDDATAGEVSYSWAAGDVDTAGTYYGYFIVTSSAKDDTFPHDGKKLKIIVHDPDTAVTA